MMRRSLHAAAMGAVLIVLAASGARAQSMVGGFSANYSGNANKPINITADMLEVDDKKKIATFKGNVTAIQGDFNMKSRELVINYTTSGTAGGKKDGGVAGGSSGGAPVTAVSGMLPGGGNSEIKEILAKGDVILTTKDNQEARSDAAVFDVKTQLVTMLGNVRLAKGQDNIIKGEKVVINLTESTTKIENPGQANTGQGNSGRISATFTPTAREKDKDKGKDAAKDANKEKNQPD